MEDSIGNVCCKRKFHELIRVSLLEGDPNVMEANFRIP